MTWPVLRPILRAGRFREGAGQRWPGAAILAVSLSVAMGACGSDAETPQAAVERPASTTSTLVRTEPRFDGTVDDVPRPDGSSPVGPPTDEDGITSRSFSAPLSTREVADFYRSKLAEDGWRVVAPVEGTGPDAYRGTWSFSPWTVRVSATPAPGLAGESQFSIQVWDQDVAPPTTG